MLFFNMLEKQKSGTYIFNFEDSVKQSKYVSYLLKMTDLDTYKTYKLKLWFTIARI